LRSSIQKINGESSRGQLLDGNENPLWRGIHRHGMDFVELGQAAG